MNKIIPINYMLQVRIYVKSIRRMNWRCTMFVAHVRSLNAFCNFTSVWESNSKIILIRIITIILMLFVKLPTICSIQFFDFVEISVHNWVFRQESNMTESNFILSVLFGLNWMVKIIIQITEKRCTWTLCRQC